VGVSYEQGTPVAYCSDTSSGEGVIFDPLNVLGSTFDPLNVLGSAYGLQKERMGQLASQKIVKS
jgi:hypothetical protein